MASARKCRKTTSYLEQSSRFQDDPDRDGDYSDKGCVNSEEELESAPSGSRSRSCVIFSFVGEDDTQKFVTEVPNMRSCSASVVRCFNKLLRSESFHITFDGNVSDLELEDWHGMFDYLEDEFKKQTACRDMKEWISGVCQNMGNELQVDTDLRSRRVVSLWEFRALRKN